MVGDHRPDRHLPEATDRPVGNGLPVEDDFAVNRNLVSCKMQVTGLQCVPRPSIPYISRRYVLTNDLQQ